MRANIDEISAPRGSFSFGSALNTQKQKQNRAAHGSSVSSRRLRIVSRPGRSFSIRAPSLGTEPQVYNIPFRSQRQLHFLIVVIQRQRRDDDAHDRFQHLADHIHPFLKNRRSILAKQVCTYGRCNGVANVRAGNQACTTVSLRISPSSSLMAGGDADRVFEHSAVADILGRTWLDSLRTDRARTRTPIATSRSVQAAASVGDAKWMSIFSTWLFLDSGVRKTYSWALPTIAIILYH